MNTKLIELETNADMLKAVVRTERVRILDDLKDALTMYVTTPCGATICNCNFRQEYTRGDGKVVEVTCELGFFNPEENRIDFGSDVYMYYNITDGISVNYGTMGTYSLKNSEYQVKRVRLINYLIDHQEEIETALHMVCETTTDYFTHETQLWEIERDIATVKRDMVKAERDCIEQSLCVGDCLEYGEDVSYRNREWRDLSWQTSTKWVITKMTPKFVFIQNKEDNLTEKIRKEQIVSGIFQKFIVHTKVA